MFFFSRGERVPEVGGGSAEGNPTAAARVVVGHSRVAVPFFDGRRDVYPVRCEFGVVRLLQAEADIERAAGIAAVGRHVGKGDHVDVSALDDVGVEIAVVEFGSDLGQFRVHDRGFRRLGWNRIFR